MSLFTSHLDPHKKERRQRDADNNACESLLLLLIKSARLHISVMFRTLDLSIDLG